MNDEIQLMSDGDGLAVIGNPTAVEALLRSERLWASSKTLDLRSRPPMVLRVRSAPRSGRLCGFPIRISLALASWQSRVRLIAQPTMAREYTSNTVAR